MIDDATARIGNMQQGLRFGNTTRKSRDGARKPVWWLQCNNE